MIIVYVVCIFIESSVAILIAKTVAYILFWRYNSLLYIFYNTHVDSHAIICLQSQHR